MKLSKLFKKKERHFCVDCKWMPDKMERCKDGQMRYYCVHESAKIFRYTDYVLKTERFFFRPCEHLNPKGKCKNFEPKETK